MTTAVILAGGLARRMGGGAKSLRLLNDRPILDHVIDRIAPQVDQVILNVNGNPAPFAPYDMPIVADSIPDFAGPLAGVLAGLDWAADHGDSAVISVAADTPFLPADLVVRLQADQGPSGMCLAATRDGVRRYLQPTFGLWPVVLRDDLRAALRGGTRKITHWTERHNAGIADFPVMPNDPFFNINTPEDLITAQSILS